MSIVSGIVIGAAGLLAEFKVRVVSAGIVFDSSTDSPGAYLC